MSVVAVILVALPLLAAFFAGVTWWDRRQDRARTAVLESRGRRT